jgi:hypothetical protein
MTQAEILGQAVAQGWSQQRLEMELGAWSARRQSQPAQGHSALGHSAQGQPAQGHSALGHSAQGQPAQGHSALGHSALGHSAQSQPTS